MNLVHGSIAIATAAALALVSFAPAAGAGGPPQEGNFGLAAWALSGNCGAGPRGAGGVATGAQCVTVAGRPVDFSCRSLGNQEHMCSATFEGKIATKRWVTEGAVTVALDGDCSVTESREWAADEDAFWGRVWTFTCTTGEVFVPYAGCARHTTTATIDVEGLLAPTLAPQEWKSEVCFG